MNRAIWKNKKGKVEGVDLVECGAEMFDIVNKVRTIFEGKNKTGVFCMSGLSPSKRSWTYGVYRDTNYFFNKIVMSFPLDYEYVYCFKTGKVYKVLGV